MTETYPLGRLQRAVDRFLKVLLIDVNRLDKHKHSMQQCLEDNDWKGLNREQINARGTVRQLKSYMEQLEHIRLQVRYEDLPNFDKQTADIKNRTVLAIQEFLLFYSTDEFANRLSWPVPSQSQSEPDFESSNDYLREAEKYPELPVQTQLLVNRKDSEYIDPQTQQSWINLHQSLEELSELMQTFAQTVHAQQDQVNSIEDNLIHAEHNVNEGAINIVQTSRLKAAMYPSIGAIFGGAFGGPVGVLAGFKAGGAAAIGGGIVGFTGGRLWRKWSNQSNNSDLKQLEEKS